MSRVLFISVFSFLSACNFGFEPSPPYDAEIVYSSLGVTQQLPEYDWVTIELEVQYTCYEYSWVESRLIIELCAGKESLEPDSEFFLSESYQTSEVVFTLDCSSSLVVSQSFDFQIYVPPQSQTEVLRMDIGDQYQVFESYWLYPYNYVGG